MPQQYSSSISDLLGNDGKDADEKPGVAEKLDEKMHKIDLAKKEELAQARAASLGLFYVNLMGFAISPETLAMIPEEEARRLRAVPFLYTGRELRLAATKPENTEVIDLMRKLGEAHQAQAALYVVSDHGLDTALKLYAGVPKKTAIQKGVKITEEEFSRIREEISDLQILKERLGQASVTDMVTMIIAGAIQGRASDIHVEAEEKKIVLRYRIDGVMQDVSEIDKKLWGKIIARFKLLAALKINVEDKPQDGRFSIFLTKEKIDVRVSTLPTAFGESLVMRLLMSSRQGLNLEDLGVRGQAMERMKEQIQRPNGMVISTGPTGSGKTTTQYAILTALNDGKTKIVTIEDPIEYELEGVNQSQVDPARDYTFAKGLRSIVRQDPDIILIGEIRDLETADISIQAALTGHLVLSTIHTNSAAGTIPRFLALGAKDFLLGPAINAMIGQRLVRRICDKCKKEIQLDEKTLERVKKALAPLTSVKTQNLASLDFNNLKFYESEGCEACEQQGYKGRIGIFEIMTMDKDLEKAIAEGQVSEYVMQEIAVKSGMITMVQDGLLKALDGLTTVAEVFRVAE